MNQRRHLTVIAAITTLMASAPLSVLFIEWTWMIQAVIAVALICGAALVARAMRAPVWAQPIATLFALLLALTWISGGGHAFGGILPSPDTFRHFGTLLSSAGEDLNIYGTPVEDRPGFLFLSTAGVGFIAILVDLLAVGLRRPALAGLPMLAIYAVPVEIDPRSVSIIPFAIGAVGFMWLLVTDNIDRVRLFGRRFTGEGRGVDMWEPSPLATTGRRIALIGMALAILIPVAAPGFSNPLIPALGGGNGTGGGKGTCRGSCPRSGTVNLFATLSGELHNSTTTVMATVKADNASPGYLRFGVADNLTAKGFQPSTLQGAPISRGLPNPPFTDASGASAGQVDFTRHTATVTIRGLRLPLLPIYLAPVSGMTHGIPNSYDFDSSTAELFSTRLTTAGQTYSFTYDQPNYSPQQLRTAPGLTPNDPLEVAYGRPPDVVAQVTPIVNDALRNATNEYDVVLNLYNFFSTKNGFSYQLSTKQGTTGSDIGDFLQQRRGYCVQYAAALAWLVRSAGFPSRVAFGFTEGNAVTGQPDTFDVTNQNLHAWTEVYFPNFGWVPFDATPATSVPGSIRTQWAPDANSLKNQGPQPTVPQSNTSAGAGNPGGPNQHQQRDPDAGKGIGGVAGHTSDWGLWALIGFLIVVAIAATPKLSRIVVRGRRAIAERRVTSDSAAPGEPYVVVEQSVAASTSTRRVHAAWDEFVDILIDYGIAVDPAESPQTTAERVVRSQRFQGEAAASTRLIGASEQRARYARHPGPGQPLADRLRTIRRTLAGQVSLSTRLRAQLLPPSVTRRWASWSVMTASNTAARGQSVRDAIGRLLTLPRWLSPRRLMADRSR